MILSRAKSVRARAAGIMELKIFDTRAPGAMEECAAILLRGGVGVIPTDTVYGLAAHPAFPDAVARLYAIKGRDGGKPVALLAAGSGAVESAGFALGAKAAQLAALHWPGALTLVVERADGRCEGFRVPAHDWTRKLIARCGGLLRVTSANLSGDAPAVDCKAAVAALGGKIDFACDGGAAAVGVASAVVKVLPDSSISILRPGPLAL